MGRVENERKHRQRRARLRARRYRRMLDQLPYGVLLDSNGEVRYANEAAARLFGVAGPTALLRRPYTDLIVATPLVTGQAAQQALRRVDGRVIEVEAVATMLGPGHRRWRQTLVRPLPASTDGLTTGAPVSEPDVVASLVVDGGGKIVQWSPTAEQLLGYSASELVGRSLAVLIPDDERERQRFDDILREAAAHGFCRVEGWKRRKDGTRFFAAQEITLLTGSGSAAPGFAVVMRELTPQAGDVQAFRRTEDQLRQAQRMEAVGRLASGIAHDFNNLLTAIQGHAQFLTEDLEPDHPSRADVEEILHSSDRAAALTRQLLSFSRGQAAKPETIQLNAVVTSMERLLRRVISEDIIVESLLDPQVWPVRADPTQVEQILVNLIVNARDAMPRGGRITIRTTNAELSAEYAGRHEDVLPGDYVMLAVSDTGSGMDRETQAHIFEPFFTTKAPEKGTGLGLSTVFGIVKQMNGYIYVYSELGQGTTFKIYIPRAGSPRAAQIESGYRSRSGEGVLVVEDDDAVRLLARRVLEARGYRVWNSSTPEHALEIIEEIGDKLSLLVTDVVLPGMNGQMLAQRAQAIRPSLPVIFMSGYSAEELQRHSISSAEHFLEKPFTPEALAGKVRSVLDATFNPRQNPQ